MKIIRVICYILYYLFARHLPVSNKPYSFGSKHIRYWICKPLLKKCGINVNIEHGAEIGSGRHIIIEDHSGIGVNCVVKRAIIGKYVMMGPDVVFINQNHIIDDSGPEPRIYGHTDYPPLL